MLAQPDRLLRLLWSQHGRLDRLPTYADEDDGMRAITAGPGEVLTLELEDCREFRSRCPEIYQVLIDCAAFVNWRRIERGARSVLALSYR